MRRRHPAILLFIIHCTAISCARRLTCRPHYRTLALCLISLLTGLVTHAQIAINEVLADNRAAVSNGSDFSGYIELHNASDQPANLDGMSLSNDPLQPRLFVFPSGTTINPRGYLTVWCDPNVTSPGLHTGFGLRTKGDLVRLYATDGFTIADEIAFGLQAPDLSIGRIPDGSGPWMLTQPTAGATNSPQPMGASTQLRINEWMTRPDAGDDWLEVFNSDNGSVKLGGLVFTDRPSGTPSNRAIPAFSFIAGHGFVQFFASDLRRPDADHLDFRLSSSGETLTIYAPDRATVLNRVTFGAQSDNIAQGRAPDGADSIISFPPGGATPGANNFREFTNVVISEVLSHTDPPLEDAIELHNPTTTPVDISHWWLSDSVSQPKRFRIPPGTTIPAGGFKVFYQFQLETGPIGFSLNSSEGDEVLLCSGDAGGNLTGEQTLVKFGALRNGVAVGRHATSVGVDFVPLRERTFGMDNPPTVVEFRQGNGMSNAPPLVPSVVINEIMFRPPDVNGQSNSDDEFIELHNPTTLPALLFDPLYPTNAWRLRDGVTFDFPVGLSIPAGEFLLLVSFDPSANPTLNAAFRSKYNVPENVPILGPYSGRLNDAGEALGLQVPDTPQGPEPPNPGFVPYMEVERINYSPSDPWPLNADGTGFSLQRRQAIEYGNDPLNWTGAAPTPGRPDMVDSDGDGMPNAWEELYQLDPDSGADATEDADGDRSNNLAEYLAGTSPRDQQSVFAITTFSVVQDGFDLRFHAVAGRTYSLQLRENADYGVWMTRTNIGAVPVTGKAAIFVMKEEANRYLRLVTPAVP